MTKRRGRSVSSILEDETLSRVEDRRDEPSPGDICEDCDCPLSDHTEEGCKCRKCGGFKG